MELSQKTAENIHEFIYLVHKYPKKKLGEIMKMFRMPIIDMNALLWAAEDQGMLSVDKESGEITLSRIPTEWKFTSKTEELMQTLKEAMFYLNKHKEDVDEENLTSWTSGYPPSSAFIALNRLQDEGFIETYTIEDAGLDTKKKGQKMISHYVMYTLKGNKKHQWGLKLFKNKRNVKVL